MSLFGSGLADYFQLGIIPTAKDRYGYGYVDTLTRIPFDLEGVQCISSGNWHSVIIKSGSVYVTGYDEDFRIGNFFNKHFKEFTKILINKEPITWAACGDLFTLYLNISGKVILCHARAKRERDRDLIQVNLDKKAVSVFAGEQYGGIIDEEGAIHITDRDDPYNPPQRFHLGVPVIDLACCIGFTCALTLDGRVYANGILNKNLDDFVEVSSLKGKNIEKLSGFHNTCAALSTDGHLFVYGENDYGQLGDGTTQGNYSSFTEVKFNEEIIDVCCSHHTLFLTKSNKIFGCGRNDSGQLLKKTKEKIFPTPIHISTIEDAQIIAGCNHSFVIQGIRKLENPAKRRFKALKNDKSIVSKNKVATNQKNNDVDMSILLAKIEEQQEKIDSLVSLCQGQSQIINHLVNICQNIEQQDEDNRNQMQSNNKSYRRKFEKIDKRMNEIDSKLDVVVKYINDLDAF